LFSNKSSFVFCDTKLHDTKLQFIIDLAALYEIETNFSVKRNIKRIPKDFMFKLTKEEFEDLSVELN
jgi:hypothetical protein